MDGSIKFSIILDPQTRQRLEDITRNGSAPAGARKPMSRSVNSGAMMTSVKISTILRAAAASSVRLSATTPP